MKTELPDNSPLSHSHTMFHHHNPQQEQTDSHSPTLQNGIVSETPLPLLLPPPSSTSSGRPRGRPPGSKNKPKPPIIITTDPPDPPMSPHVLEFPPGSDIIDSTTRFCRKRNIGLTILNGNGAVSNITLKNPSSVPGSTVTFHGQFELLSLTATILPDGFEGGGGFGVSVAGPQGQVVGGLVVGPLVAAGTVYLVGATFNNPVFCRLGDGGDVAGDGNGEFCGVVWEQNGGREVQQPQQQQQHY